MPTTLQETLAQCPYVLHMVEVFLLHQYACLGISWSTHSQVAQPKMAYFQRIADLHITLGWPEAACQMYIRKYTTIMDILIIGFKFFGLAQTVDNHQCYADNFPAVMLVPRKWNETDH